MASSAPVQFLVALELNHLILVFFPLLIPPASSLLRVETLPSFELNFACILHPVSKRVVRPILVFFVLPEAKLLHLFLIGFPVLEAVDTPAFEVLFVVSLLPVNELYQRVLVFLPNFKRVAFTSDPALLLPFYQFSHRLFIFNPLLEVVLVPPFRFFLVAPLFIASNLSFVHFPLIKGVVLALVPILL